METLLRRNRRLLSELLSNQGTYESILEMVGEDHIRAACSLVRFLTWAGGRERALEFWCQYRRLRGVSPDEQKEHLKAKLTGASLTEVISLLLKVGGMDPGERDWLLTEVLDEDVLGQAVEGTSLSAMKSLLWQLPNEHMVSHIIGKFNPNSVAEKAKASTAQGIMWFLIGCSKDTANKDFANSFLLAMHEGGELVAKLKNSPLGTVLRCLGAIGDINPGLREQVNADLSPHWLPIWLRSSLNRIANQLYRYRWSVGERREFAQLVVRSLASAELAGSIEELYSQRETKPAKVLGKLLHSASQVASESEEEALEFIALQVVESIDLSIPQRCTIQELAHLVRNVEKCGELAYRQLLRRIVSELDLSRFISIPFDQGLAVLITDIHKQDKRKAEELANEILSLDVHKLLDSSETEAVTRLLWGLLQIDGPRTRSWMKNIGQETWLAKGLSSTTLDAFWLLWTLYHADKQRGTSVTRSLANNVLSDLTTLEPEDLPLLGFIAFLDIQFDLNIPFPSPRQIARKTRGFTELAFCVYLLRQNTDELFVRELGKQLSRIRSLTFLSKEVMIERFPFGDTRQVLRETLRDFDFP